MGTFKVMTSTISFGRRYVHVLGTVTASDRAVAERTMERQYPIVTGYRTPWLEEVSAVA